MEKICNSGSAWGLIENQTTIKIGSLLLLLIILYLGYNTKGGLAKFGWIMIFIGGAANLYERFVYGCVKDYIKIAEWYPAFNLADGVIAAGGIILLLAVSVKKICN